jgi:lysophospholipase L1-like esterase
MKHGQLFLFQGDSITDCQRHRESQNLVTPEWEEDIRGRQDVVLRLAAEFSAIRVPFQEMFNEAVKEAPPEYWAEDGVHPTPAGHARMATFWRSRLGI